MVCADTAKENEIHRRQGERLIAWSFRDRKKDVRRNCVGEILGLLVGLSVVAVDEESVQGRFLSECLLAGWQCDRVSRWSWVEEEKRWAQAGSKDEEKPKKVYVGGTSSVCVESLPKLFAESMRRSSEVRTEHDRDSHLLRGSRVCSSQIIRHVGHVEPRGRGLAPSPTKIDVCAIMPKLRP